MARLLLLSLLVTGSSYVYCYLRNILAQPCWCFAIMNMDQARFEDLHTDVADLVQTTRLLIIPHSATGQVLLYTQVWENEVLIEAILG